MYEQSREQSKYEIRDELTKELVTKADLKLAQTELKADIKVTNLKTMFQTAIIILIILATTPGGTNLLEKIFPFIK